MLVSVKIQTPIYDDDRPQICPICGNNYTKFENVLPIEFDNDKSNGIAIKFKCETECHVFYMIIENHKGQCFMSYADESFDTIRRKPVPYPSTSENS